MSSYGESFLERMEKKSLQKKRKRQQSVHRKRRMRRASPVEGTVHRRSRCVGPEDLHALPGKIFMVGNVLLDIPKEKSRRHPCVVMDASDPLNIMVSKGTAASNVDPRYRAAYEVVEPDAENRLKTPTAFSSSPRFVSYRFLFLNDLLGSLPPGRLRELKGKVRGEGPSRQGGFAFA